MRWARWTLASTAAAVMTVGGLEVIHAQEPATEGEEPAACVAAFRDVQRLKREGKLLERRRLLSVCASAACPQIVSAKCSEWIQDAEKSQPSIVVVVKDGASDVVGYELRVDDEPIASERAGRPIELDPGAHSVEVSTRSPVRRAVRKLVVTEGEQGRRLEVDLAPPIAPKKEGGTRPPIEQRSVLARVHPVTWTSFGLTIAGLVSGAVTGGLALARASDLESECGGRACSVAVRDRYDEGVVLANVSTGSFIAAGVFAAVGLITLPILFERAGRAPRARARLAAGVVALEIPL